MKGKVILNIEDYEKLKNSKDYKLNETYDYLKKEKRDLEFIKNTDCLRYKEIKFAIEILEIIMYNL